ncbi:glycosyltransferase [bacterium]|nr:glycosyltransferase [bacterium]
MRLLLLNDTYFGDTIRDRVDDLLRVGPDTSNNIVLDPDRDDLFEAVDESGFKPDAILQVDSLNRRVFFRGIERFTQPMAFYAVDAPINEYWQRHYASQFDRVWVDQHEVWRSLSVAGVGWARWLPLSADPEIYYPPKRETDRDIPLLFVGSIDSELRPKRSAILHRLRQITDVHVVDGGGARSVGPNEVADLYRRSRIVLNELLFDGINLRTFEAMACGAVVLTEQARGEEMLFTDGYSLVTFNQSNIEAVVQNLLDHPSRTEHIGYAGSTLVMEKHTLGRRANQVVNDLERLRVRKERFTRESRADALWGIMLASLKWGELEQIRQYTAEELYKQQEGLEPFRRDLLADLLQKASPSNGNGSFPEVSPSMMNVVKAARALSKNDGKGAAGFLGLESTDPLDIHTELGKLLYGVGQDMTPGFNRSILPVTMWTAFEHFLHVVREDPTNLEAMEHLDRILVERNAVEFTLPLWQRYHLNQPKDRDSETMLKQRARMGYVIQPDRSQAREGSSFPLRTSSRRTTARIPSPGTGAGRS